MVRMGLLNSKLVHGNPERGWELGDVRSNTAILYPTPASTPLEHVPDSKRPDQLIVIDGTWPQAKSMFRDLPLLRSLPAYRLTTDVPGNFRIRREPTDQSLSTIEATVAALQILEPETKGLDGLIQVFDAMVDRQLAHPKAQGHYCGPPKSGFTINVPNQLKQLPVTFIIAYGEYNHRGSTEPQSSPPLIWLAAKVNSNDFSIESVFRSKLNPASDVPPSFLAHLDVNEVFFDDAESVGQFEKRWSQFAAESDLLLVYRAGTVELLRSTNAYVPETTIPLKLIRISKEPRHSGLEKVVQSAPEFHQSVVERFPGWGRAARRLADNVLLAKWIHQHQSSQAKHT